MQTEPIFEAAARSRNAGNASMQGRRRQLGGGSPVNTIAPAITGTPKHGSVLSCDGGTWTGSPALTYQWRTAGVDISGETGSTYTVDRADGVIGPSITCRVTANGSVTADSNALAWTFATLTNVRTVYDAAQGVTLVGSDVDALADQGPGANHLTTSARPLYNATDAAFNNQPTIEFDGTAEFLRIAAFDWGSLTAGSTATLLKLVTNTNGEHAWSYNGAGTRGAETTTGRISDRWISNSAQTPGTNFFTAPHLRVSTYASSLQNVWDDNTQVVTNNAVANSFVNSLAFALGATSTGASLFSNVKFAFWLCTTSAMSSDDRNDLDAYVAWRFGL